MLVAKPGKQGGSSYTVNCFRNSYQSKGLIAELARKVSKEKNELRYWLLEVGRERLKL